MRMPVIAHAVDAHAGEAVRLNDDGTKQARLHDRANAIRETDRWLGGPRSRESVASSWSRTR